MGTKMLRYESSEKLLILESECHPYSEEIDSWRVSETFQPNTLDPIAKGVGGYRIVLEKPVTSQDEVWEGHRQAWQLAGEIETAWYYAFGKTFDSVSLAWVPQGEIDGWTGNNRQLDAEIQREHSGVWFAASYVVSTSRLRVTELPLENVLVALKAYRKSSVPLKFLIELHTNAHKSELGYLFHLAKALELAVEFFGKGKKGRKGLQKVMAAIATDAKVTQTVEWLFKMANTKSDIRHVVDKKAPNVAPLPPLSPQERRDFSYHANLVLRAFICSQLGIPLYLVVKGKPPEGEPPHHT